MMRTSGLSHDVVLRLQTSFRVRINIRVRISIRVRVSIRISSRCRGHGWSVMRDGAMVGVVVVVGLLIGWLVTRDGAMAGAVMVVVVGLLVGMSMIVEAMMAMVMVVRAIVDIMVAMLRGREAGREGIVVDMTMMPFSRMAPMKMGAVMMGGTTKSKDRKGHIRFNSSYIYLRWQLEDRRGIAQAQTRPHFFIHYSRDYISSPSIIPL